MRELNTNFRDSVQDLVWMLERGYPKKPAIEAVGNRYRLNHNERMILYRGVFDLKTAERRRKKIIDPFKSPAGKLLIDGYNVFITIFSYLKGMCVFRAFDGYVRDVSEVFGSVRITDQMKRSIDALVSFMEDLTGKTEVCILLDKPKKEHEDSINLLSIIETKTQYIHQSVDVRMVKSVDSEISKRAEPSTAVATSDTRIIEIAHKTIDIPDHIITSVFKREILDLQSIVM
jgi:hypothetical protein